MEEAKCSSQFLGSLGLSLSPWLGVTFAALNPKRSIFLSFDQVSQYDFTILVLSLGEPWCRCCRAGTLPWIIYNISVPSEHCTIKCRYGLLLLFQCNEPGALAARTVGGCTWAQSCLCGNTPIQVWEYCRIMPFPSPAECGAPNPRWCHQQQSLSWCSAGVAKGKRTSGLQTRIGAEFGSPLGAPGELSQPVALILQMVLGKPSLLHCWGPAETRSFAASCSKPRV